MTYTLTLTSDERMAAVLALRADIVTMQRRHDTAPHDEARQFWADELASANDALSVLEFSE